MAGTPAKMSITRSDHFNAFLARRYRVGIAGPLAGVTGQDTASYSTAWIQIGVGANLVLKAVYANVTGTMTLSVKTCSNPNDNSENPRVLGSFPQISAAGNQHQSFPGSDEYIQVVATPGNGVGQACDWTLTGQITWPGK
jgi:hypothetical protein